MLRAIYSEIKYIIHALLTSYRTSVAGVVLILFGVYLYIDSSGEKSSEAVGFIITGAGLIAGQDVQKPKAQ